LPLPAASVSPLGAGFQTCAGFLFTPQSRLQPTRHAVAFSHWMVKKLDRSQCSENPAAYSGEPCGSNTTNGLNLHSAQLRFSHADDISANRGNIITVKISPVFGK